MSEPGGSAAVSSMMGPGRAGGQRWSHWSAVTGTLPEAVKIGGLGIGVDAGGPFAGLAF